MIGLAVVVGMVAMLGHTRSETTMTRLLDQEVRIAELGLRSKTDALLGLRYMKDFLLDSKLSFVEDKARYVILVGSFEAQVHENMALIRTLTLRSEVVRLTNAIDKATSQREESFRKLVELAELRRADVGLEYRLADQGAKIGAAARQSGLDQLILDSLAIQNVEKTYLLHGFEKDFEHSRILGAQFAADVAHASLQPLDKQFIRSLAEGYLILFQQLVELDGRIAAESEAYLTATHTIEPLLDNLYNVATQAQHSTYTDVQRFTHTVTCFALANVIPRC